MIVTVRDPDVLSSLDPQQVENYLQAKGWDRESQIGKKESVWIKTTESGEEFDITLPLNPEIRAFALRMSEILETLEIAEGCSQLEILSDLFTKAANIDIQGVVIKLQEKQYLGNVTIMGFVVGRLQKIHVQLSEPEYTLAIKAYQERLPVICSGDLIKEGSEFVLKNPRHFALDKAWTY
ncbi:MAG TPA: hypothetical protein DCE56_44355 [Cyanobacteria bacterium UBA8553]|nr:hypothetical protein [Cyanobacteria bacterium UBA8553]HAJ57895.1 hypothetical protein [Cyanobacteria bacterium UBA8543]